MNHGYVPPIPAASKAFTLLVLCLVIACPYAEAVAGDDPKPRKLFESDDTLDVSMISTWRELVRDEQNQEGYPAKLEYTDELGNAESLGLTVERRGVTRQRVCKIPPVKLRFEKGSAKGTTFRGQENLKMVTHCQMSERYEQYYLLEMLAYRMYNLLTDFSFKVRPLTVTYYQTGYENEKESRFGIFKKKTHEGPVFAFLIEDDKDVANRHDMNKLHLPRIPPDRLDTDEAALFALFQFMIANVDWAATSGPDPNECCHNVKLIGPEPTKPEDILYAIPYDFDSSGLVDSEYAAPPQGLPISQVTERLYRGYCAHNPSLETARQKILANESAIYKLIESENRLEPGTRSKALEFLGGFFEIMKNDDQFREHVVEKCRG